MTIPTGRDHARHLAPLFSSSVLLELARRGHSASLAMVVHEARPVLAPGSTYADFFEYCHEQLWTHHRCEYVYKNAIASKILLGRHSLRTTRFLTEFRVAQCKADVVLINGTSTCYEVKTELDDLGRLSRQLGAYSRVFDKTYVVTFPDYAARVLQAVPAAIGVLVLTDDYTLSERREAKSNRLYVDPLCIFDSLRREEYLAVLRDAEVQVPAVPNTRIYSACKELFGRLPPHVAHDGMVRVLKRRRVSSHVSEFTERCPASLRAALLSAPLTRAEVVHLTNVLQQELA